MIDLSGGNNAPFARDDTMAADEDSGGGIQAADLLANDADFDGDALTVSSVDGTSAAGATVSFDSVTGAIDYDPGDLFQGLAVGESATDSFDYTVSDGNGGTRTASVTVTVDGVNDAPVAGDDPEGIATVPTTTPIATVDEFRVNSTVANDQQSAYVAKLSNGGYVVTWDSFGQDGSDYGVYGTIYDAEHNVVANEIQFNVSTGGRQAAAQAFALDGGGFVVRWYGQDGSSGGPFARIYNDDGTARTGEFGLNTTTSANQEAANIIPLSGGKFLAIWASEHHDGSQHGVVAREFDGSGNALTGEFLVNETTSGFQFGPSGTLLDDGTYVVTWWGAGNGDGNGVFARHFNANNTPIGGEFRVNSETANTQQVPDIAMLGNGEYVIVWESQNQDGSGFGIRGQRFSADSQPIGSEFAVNTETGGDQRLPSVTALNDGGFLVNWRSDGQDGDNYGNYAQRFDDQGERVGEEFRLNQETLGGQFSQHHGGLAQLNDGQIVGAWQSDGQDGDAGGIYARAFSIEETLEDLPPEFTTEAGSALTIDDELLLANDTDIDGDTLSIVSVQNDAGGTPDLGPTGDVVFTPTDGFSGIATFDYTVSDGNGGTDTATVSVQVEPAQAQTVEKIFFTSNRGGEPRNLGNGPRWRQPGTSYRSWFYRHEAGGFPRWHQTGF